MVGGVRSVYDRGVSEREAVLEDMNSEDKNKFNPPSSSSSSLRMLILANMRGRIVVATLSMLKVNFGDRRLERNRSERSVFS